MSVLRLLAVLERRQVITTDPSRAETCCGNERDEDGFCIYRPHHPIYVDFSVYRQERDLLDALRSPTVLRPRN